MATISRTLSLGLAIALASAFPRLVLAQVEPTESIDLRASLQGEGRPMTADRAAAIAVATGPSVDGAREAVRRARAGADRAVYGFVPQVTLTAAYTRLALVDNGSLFDADQAQVDRLSDPAARRLFEALADGSPSGLDQFALRGSLSFPVSDAFLEILPRYEAARGVAEATEHQIDVAAATVALGAREAFYQYARARGAFAVAQMALSQAQARQDLVRAHADVGDVSPADVARVRAQIAAAEVAVARAGGGVEVAAVALRSVLHVSDDVAIAIDEDVFALPPPLERSRAELVDQAARNRPEARALRRLIRARRRAVDGAEGSRLPSLILSAQAQLATPSALSFPQLEHRVGANVGVILEWSLHDSLDGERLADEARALAGEASADLRTLEDAIRRQVAEAVVGYQTARSAMVAAQAGLDAAEESRRVRIARFRTGDGLVADLIDASLDEIRAQLDLLSAAIDARVALARLRRAAALDDGALAHSM